MINLQTGPYDGVTYATVTLSLPVASGLCIGNPETLTRTASGFGTETVEPLDGAFEKFRQRDPFPL